MNRVLVIGGINLDIKAKTLGAHVAATSNPSAIVSKPGGVGRNVAHNLGALGIPVSLLSIVGNDAQGAAALAATEEAGVDVSAVTKLEGSTGIYLAVLDQSGELVTAASDMAASSGVPASESSSGLMYHWLRARCAGHCSPPSG